MARPPMLADAEIAARLKGLPGWTLRDGALGRELRFPDFVHAFSFMTRVALVAERLDHHPDWSNVYGVVSIRLSTHDAGGVTALDFELAEAISRLVG